MDTLNSNPPREAHTNQVCSACSNRKSQSQAAALSWEGAAPVCYTISHSGPDSVKCESSFSLKCRIAHLLQPASTRFLLPAGAPCSAGDEAVVNLL